MPRLDVSLQCSSGTFVKTKQLTCTLWWLIWLISSTSVWSQSVPPSGRLIPFIWSIKVSKSSLHLSQIWAFYGVQPKEQVRSFYFLRKFWTALLGYKDLLPGLQIQRECFSTFSGIWSFELQWQMPTLQRSFGSFAAFSVEAWLDDNNKSEVKKNARHYFWWNYLPNKDQNKKSNPSTLLLRLLRSLRWLYKTHTMCFEGGDTFGAQAHDFGAKNIDIQFFWNFSAWYCPTPAIRTSIKSALNSLFSAVDYINHCYLNEKRGNPMNSQTSIP